jgi:molybdopterin converting factor small subunit
MQITVRLLASYRNYLPEEHDAGAGFPLEVEPGTIVCRVVDGLPIPRDGRTTVMVNGRHADWEQRLEAGDVVAVFPAVGGGV